MKIVLVTTQSDTLGGVFAKAYLDNGGPPVSSILILPERNELGAGLVDRVVTAIKLVTPVGTARLLAAKAGLPWPSDRNLGLNLRWPAALVTPNTDVLSRQSLKNRSILADLKQLQPDLLVSIGAPIIFGRSVLAIPPIGTINIHNGLLPKYRGHFGTFWEVYHGEPWAYVCAHEMLPKVDTGRMLAWERIEVAKSRSFLDLLLEKKKRGGAMLARLLQETQQQGILPATRPIDCVTGVSDGYFAYPSWKDVLRLKLNRGGEVRSRGV